MKLIHVVPHIDKEAAGPSYSVPRLCTAISQQGNEVVLACLAAAGAIPGVRVQVYPQWSFPKSFAISPALASALRQQAGHFDIVHNHSLWSMVNVASGWVVPGRKAKLVTSPRGTLSPWALSRRRNVKRVLWSLQRRALARADLLHATSEVELAQIREQGLEAPVAIIPNGIDLPVVPAERPHVKDRTMLFLGRLHPTKGVDRLIRSWAEVEADFPDWRLDIVGRGEETYERELLGLANRFRLRHVSFLGALYGAAKSQAYLEASAFVLPTHSENFGMAVAEALAHECPAVVSQEAPWSGLIAENCGWWVKHDVPSLTESLRTVMNKSEEALRDMGCRGRRWMERDYGWESVASRMISAYRWLLDGGRRPDWVRVD